MRFALLGALALVCAAPVSAEIVKTQSGVFDPASLGTLASFGAIVGPGSYTATLDFTPGTLNSVGGSWNQGYTICSDVPVVNPFPLCNDADRTSSIALNADVTNSSVRSAFEVLSGSAFNPPQTLTWDATATLIFTADFKPRSTGGYTFTLERLGVSAVPEPSTWALLLIGFGAVGAAARRLRPSPQLSKR